MPYPFECFSGIKRRCPGQWNINNAVMVNLVGDDFYLAYLQDIDGDLVFVDFDCTKIPPWWVPADRVYRHNLYGERAKNDSKATDVFVALREDDNGPYIFRPAKLLRDSTLRTNYLCCVSINISQDPKNPFRVVHQWQLSSVLPNQYTDRPTKITEDHVEKVVVRVDNMGFMKHIDEYHITHLLDVGFRDGFNPIGWRAFDVAHKDDRDQLFVRLTGRTLTFIIMQAPCLHVFWNTRDPVILACQKRKKSRKFSYHNCTCWKKEIAKDISFGINNYLRRYCYRPEIGNPFSCESLIEEVPSLGSIPFEVQSTVLQYLDVHSQAAAKRVCSLWNALVPDPASAATVTVDFSRISDTLPGLLETEGYRTAHLLHRVVSQKTKGLTLLHLDHRTDCITALVSCIKELLALKQTTIFLISVRYCRMPFESRRVGCSNPDEPIHGKILFQLLPLKQLCRHLRIQHLVMDFSLCNIRPRTFFMKKIRDECEKTCNLMIVIPVMDVENDDENANVKSFKRALEACCPTVDNATKKRIRKLHTRWLRTIPYPNEQWTGLRRLLELFGVLEWGNTDETEAWENLDLRNFDNIPFGNLQLSILAHFYLN
ncbi:uncharacterized protein LOC129602135 [Paramacrobiotus metropolitanus]|uniref:uncharacterized protein LOC129602135 n=1 Tax=Paramacrobiotus metropolitanus TaxID=2943436 RepID=UPI0024459A8B|nr:uncharacterized protein LOC129602135 [Paramacrobiotus metropolitanus]